LGLPGRFRSEKAGGMSVTVHLKLSGLQGGDFTIRIADGKCTVKEALVGEADCVVTASDETYAGLETGRVNPTMAVMTGKVKATNIGLLMKFTGVFKRLET